MGPGDLSELALALTHSLTHGIDQCSVYNVVSLCCVQVHPSLCSAATDAQLCAESAVLHDHGGSGAQLECI